jgi:hypothetical protein
MKRNDLNSTAKRRFDNKKPCPICCEEIKDEDDIMCIVKRKRRCKEYIFYHERCLVDGKKEEATAETKQES